MVASLPSWEERVDAWIRPAPVPGYLVSRDGYVYSVRGERPVRLAVRPWGRRGHHRVELSHQGARERWYLHVLVARAFLGPPPFEGAFVLHLDGNCHNNHADNLAWGSQSLNERHKHAGPEWNWHQELVADHQAFQSYEPSAEYGF